MRTSLRVLNPQFLPVRVQKCYSNDSYNKNALEIIFTIKMYSTSFLQWKCIRNDFDYKIH